MAIEESAIDPDTPPSGDGCLECEESGGWWVHLWRCAQCGHVGCCDPSPGQHASAHFRDSGHRVVASYEPGESWFWDYASEEFGPGQLLAEPQSHPEDQPAPGPAARVPDDWRDHIHA